MINIDVSNVFFVVKMQRRVHFCCRWRRISKVLQFNWKQPFLVETCTKVHFKE